MIHTKKEATRNLERDYHKLMLIKDKGNEEEITFLETSIACWKVSLGVD